MASYNPNYISCPSGNETYSGYVYNEEGQPLQGVVVYLVTPFGFVPSSAGSTTTNASGYWTLTFDHQCPHNASFYWQSLSNGPLLMKADPIGLSTTYTVTVWEQSEDVNLLYEFPDSSNTSVSYTTSTNIEFSANAKVSGGIQDGFLGTNAAGYVGTTLTMESGFSQIGSSPYLTYYQKGITYKVEDASGNTIIYVQSFASSLFSSANTQEYLTMSQGITDAENKGENPYVTIAGNHQQSYQYTFSTTTTLDGQVSVTAFGVTLTTEVSTSSGTTQTVALTITNKASQNECYVVYQEGPEIHAWYYFQGICP